MKNIALTVSFLFAVFFAEAQTPASISIDSCYAWARRQYPLIKQKDLIEKSREFTIANASKGYLPQFSITGQATYQSAVTKIPIPNISLPNGEVIDIPVPTKEQFNVHGELSQTIYDGGAIKQQKQSQRAASEVQQQSLEVQLYNLRDRINQVFFGALLINEQLKQNALLQKDLQNSIDKMQAAVNAGTALSSNLDELQANMMVQQQNEISLKSSHKAYMDIMSLFIAKPLDETTVLETPPAAIISDNIKRPELLQYDAQKRGDDVQAKILNTTTRPRFSAFVQGGYALPGLNAFDARAALYYIGGLRLSWNMGSLYTIHNQKQILSIDQQSIDAQRETFLFNTSLTLRQQSADISKLQQLISKDNDIIAKRSSVTKTAKAQMDEGAITIHEYITELNAEDGAKQNLLLHQVQLLLDEYNYQNTTGN